MKRTTARPGLRWIAAALVLCLAGWWFSPALLTAMGGYLVTSEEPFDADIVVVLAGDGFGHRLLKGAELVRNGFAPQVLVSGPTGFYGVHEAELAIRFAARKGFPAEWFVAAPHNGRSTREEGAILAKVMRARGVKRFLLVTSNFHTRRSAGVFREAVPEMEFRVVAAPDEYFTREGWWHTRQGQKRVFDETVKTVAYWFGI